MGNSGPELRTVVLRHVNPGQRQLLCHTDFRSPKVREFLSFPAVSWLFYHPKNKLQLRIRGVVEVHHANDIARKRWEKSSESSRQCYAADQAPGAFLDSPAPIQATAAGFANFAVIDCRVETIDWLFLRYEGHVRAHFSWQNEGWQSRWIAP